MVGQEAKGVCKGGHSGECLETEDEEQDTEPVKEEFINVSTPREG